MIGLPGRVFNRRKNVVAFKKELTGDDEGQLQVIAEFLDVLG